MYFYHLLSSKAWQKQQDEDQRLREQGQHFLPRPKRIKHYYDCGYDDIVKLLVNYPESCKNFYPLLQQLGLPYQSYYDKSADKVTRILKTALFTETAILIELPPRNGYFSSSASPSLEATPYPAVKKEPMYQPDDSWITVDLINHRPVQIDIINASNVREHITTAQTSADDIFLKHGDVFSISQVLPKVHILLGGMQGDYNLANRGDKSLRVKTLAQAWLDELSELLRSGNSPFSIEQDEALASIINHGFSPQYNPNIKALDESTLFRPDERIGALFYRLLLVLDTSHFFMARQRTGDLGYDDSEGAIFDAKSFRMAIKSLNTLRHSEGYDKDDYSYNSDTVASLANDYLNSPLIDDGTGGANDLESKLKNQINHDAQVDKLSDISHLYFTAIKLLKQLREPGIIKNVATRQDYLLRATKLKFNNIELKQTQGFYLEYHKDHKYQITSLSEGHRFIGRFNGQGLADIKVPHKWAHIDDWQLVTAAVDGSFIDEFFADITPSQVSDTHIGMLAGSPLGQLGAVAGGIIGCLYGDKIRSTYLEYENQILGTAQVAGGVMTLAAAGTVEIGTGGLGTALAISLGFLGSDNIAAGLSRMATDKAVTTIGEDVIAWSGLVPKGYEGLVYGLVDLSVGGKAIALAKLSGQTHNLTSLKLVTPPGKKPNLIKDVQVWVTKLTKNNKNQRHVVKLKNADSVVEKQFITYKISDLSKVSDEALNISKIRNQLTNHVKSGNIDDISLAIGSIKTSERTEYVLAVSGNSWKGNSPQMVNIKGIDYKVIITDSKSVQSVATSVKQTNYNHAEQKLFSYIQDTYKGEKVDIELAVQNTSSIHPGMCTGCKSTSQIFAETNKSFNINIYQGTTGANP